MLYLISLLSVSASIVGTLTVLTLQGMSQPEPVKVESESKMFWEGSF